MKSQATRLGYVQLLIPEVAELWRRSFVEAELKEVQENEVAGGNNTWLALAWAVHENNHLA